MKHPVSAMECVEEKNVTYVKGYDADWSGDCKETENTQVMKTGIASGENTDASGISRAQILLEEAVKAAAAADSAVIFAGLPEAFETEGCDRDDMKLPDNQNR